MSSKLVRKTDIVMFYVVSETDRPDPDPIRQLCATHAVVSDAAFETTRRKSEVRAQYSVPARR